MIINESFSNVRKKYILAFNDIHVMSAWSNLSYKFELGDFQVRLNGCLFLMLALLVTSFKTTINDTFSLKVT